jgi:hypothetical protein
VALAERIKKASKPPNLRRGNARQNCGGCQFFGRGECMLYGYPVRASQVCDSFKAKETKR